MVWQEEAEGALWVDSGTSSSHHATDRLTPHSCYSKDAKFNGMTCWSRPQGNRRYRNVVSQFFELDVSDHLFGKPLYTSIKSQVQGLTLILNELT
jgi:hypothetical protein